MKRVLTFTLLTLTLSAAPKIIKVAPESLSGHVSFLASDALEGRRSPSTGLDTASEYIASWFRRLGLEAPVAGSYFQVAKTPLRVSNAGAFHLTIESGSTRINIPASAVSGALNTGASLRNQPLFKLQLDNAASLEGIKSEDVNGRIVLLVPKAGLRLQSVFGSLSVKLAEWKSATVLVVDPASNAEGFGVPRLGIRAVSGILRLHSQEVAGLAATLPFGLTNATVSLDAAKAEEQTAELRNVAGILRGTNPKLNDSYIMVSAHYDHIGRLASGKGDLIFNGANDDASGVAMMLEMAAVLKGRRPKRSILFVAFYGEESGLVGSRYFGKNAFLDLNKIVAQVNLEQMGRTDVDGANQLAAFNLTGFDFTDLNLTLIAAAKPYHVRLFKKEAMSDPFFSRSDNQALADVGVPSTTASLGYEFPDYHGLGDSWEKLDYKNMAQLTAAMSAGIRQLANNKMEPRWIEANPAVKKYVDAWKARQPKK